ncbi:hypothetical protein [Sulfurimonas sp. HSL-1716]|uniref:hypothetical protein n=1 Tax=Hydrocurvibacter sulfurireducens TaxID=3131937 RepID=UPI0031F9A7AB
MALFPLLIATFFQALLKKKFSYKIHKIDFSVFLFFIFIFINLIVSSIRGTLFSQFIFVLYVVVPLFIYLYIRLINYDISSFTRLIYRFTLLYALYVIAEFLLYYFFPELKGVITHYLQYIVKTNNFYPPTVKYPIIGVASKPWGPMFDTSATGAFLVVLFAFIFDSRKYIKKDSLNILIFLAITAIFLSGSKSAYMMFLIYIVLRTTLFKQAKATKLYLFFLTLIFFTVILAIVSFINFFFTDELLNWYIYAMVTEPVSKLISGFYQNGIFTLIGSGQENGYYKIFGMGEIDFFNAIFRYGLFSMMTFLSLIVYLIVKYKRKYAQFSIMFIMFIMSMVHYQVILKFPASMILFISIGVLANEEIKKNRYDCNKGQVV